MTSRQLTNIFMDERLPRIHSLVTAVLIFFSSIPDPVLAENFTISYLATFVPVRGHFTRGIQGKVISGAVSYAIRKINADPNLLPGHLLTFVHADSGSDALIGMEIMSQHWKDGCAAFFGPEDSCEFEGKLAAAWNLPMFAYKCVSRQVSDKTQYPTFIRTSPLAHQVTKSVLSLLIHFRWRHFTIVSGSSEAWQSISAQLEDMALRFRLALNHPIQLFQEPYSAGSDQSDPVEIWDIVENTYIDTRVYVFLGARNALVDLMLAMDKKQLFEQGQYSVIYIDIDNFNVSANLDKYFRHDYDHPELMPTIEMARSLLVIVPSPLGNPDNYQRFVENVNIFNAKHPFNFIHKTVSIYAAYLYDAIYLYARALDEVINSGGDPYDGRAIVDSIRGRSFSSIQGFMSNIDDNGDAEGNYTVLSRQLVLSRSQHPFAMLPVAFFKLQANQSEQLPTFVLFENKNINWTSGAPPDDKPVCGYRGENCISPSNLTKEIFAGVLGGLILVGIILALIVYRNWRYEQEIAGLLWKVNIEDVQGFDKAFHGSKGTLLSQGSMDSHMSFNNQIFTLTGKFRGQVVALKRYTRRTTEITRSLKKEMKLMRELHHDNVTAFVGACVDPPSIILLTEYCSKGSLQDILENDDINLDSMFVASFVMDLIKGMLFLHDSELHFHGNLKSSNCVVTSCWTLQVADYGLLTLRHSVLLEQDTTDEYVRCKNKLWTAPELLRDKGRAVRDTQKADVYAFGIILHEIIARQGPFGDVGMSVIEIVEGVRNPVPGFPYVRPNVSQIACQDFIIACMQDCWNESPCLRPDFRSIRTRLKPMMHGMKPNIFDNMIAMMEKYQTQLEELVADRTGQLVDEKRKTEALLLRMLPKSVVDQLVRGQAVIPETFTSVTIYFSDICGFTTLSAESSPMQVVDLLNDLYTMFDSIISHYDVYKVETIGDAYMVVSGLPLRNGDSHAGQIASMALSLLSAIKSFQIRHRPNETLKLRVGIHSGPCVAGVVGLTMPRYCLFGDTVNTASRMESNGEPLKIHVSGDCKRILDKLGGYETEPRGNVSMKGKGEMFTYWLLSDDSSRFQKLFRAKSAESDTANQPLAPRGGGRDGARRPSRRPADDLVEQVNDNNNDFLGLLREKEAFTEARRKSDGDRRRMMMRLGLHQRRVFDGSSPTRTSNEHLPQQPLTDLSDGAVSAQRVYTDCNRKYNSFRSPRPKGQRDEIPVAVVTANGGLNCVATQKHLVGVGVADGDELDEGHGEEREGDRRLPAEWDRLLEETTTASEDFQLSDISTLCV